MIRINIYKGNTEELLTNMIKVLIILPHGYLLTHSNEFHECDLDHVFDVLNWSCWTDKKPELLLSYIYTCGSGIIVNPDDTNDYYLALSIGWKHFTSFKELYMWYSKNWNDHGAMLKNKKDGVVNDN